MKQILVVRKDLKMGRGKEIAQAAHASLAATLENMEDPRVKTWLAGLFTKIAVGADSEDHLLEIKAKAEAAGLITRLITDSGLTVFKGVPTNTVLAVGPDTDENLRPVTGDLKLL